MPFARTHLQVDCSLYEGTQLTDAEIIEREAVRQTETASVAGKKRERRRRLFAFHWSGGML